MKGAATLGCARAGAAASASAMDGHSLLLVVLLEEDNSEGR